MATPAVLQEAPDFSLVLGGAIFQLFRRSHLSGGGLELLHRRIIRGLNDPAIPLFAFAGFAQHRSCRLQFVYATTLGRVTTCTDRESLSSNG